MEILGNVIEIVAMAGLWLILALYALRQLDKKLNH